MPRKVNNLEGLLRDLRHAIDNGLEEAYQFAELAAEADDLIDWTQRQLDASSAGDSGDEDASDAAGGQLELHVGSDDAEGGAELGQPAPVHDARSGSPIRGSSRMAHEVGHRRATELANQAVASSAGGVVRTRVEVTRKLVGG